MATPRDDSYSSVAAVTALTRFYLDDEAAYNSTTTPTEDELVAFIDEASGLVNVAARRYGFDPAELTANSTAKLILDNWVRGKAARMVHLSNPHLGSADGDEENPLEFYDKMGKGAADLIKENVLGFQRLGITQDHKASDGLNYTGEDVQTTRDDPKNKSLAQPSFKRGKFDNG
jgi:hypothetical protein